MNAAEDRLSELMDAATRALHPPVEAIIAEGERLGRSRRRRRRTAVATSTAAVMLLAGAGAAAGLRLSRSAQYDAADAAHVLHRPSPVPKIATALAPPSAPPTLVPTPPQSAAEALTPITSTAAVNILKMTVPATWKYGAYKPSDFGPSLLDVDVDDGKGLARISVSVESTSKTGADPLDCTSEALLLQNGGKRPSGAPQPSCVVRHYPDGDQVMQEVLRADPYGEYKYRVIALRTDRIMLEITAANGDSSSESTEVTRITPPLTIDQMTAIALDRAWQLQVPGKLAEAKPAE